MKRTKTLYWDYTGPWNFYRRQWRSSLFTWFVLAWEVGLLIATHYWLYAAGVAVLVLAACIPLLTWYRTVKPQATRRAVWAERERAAVTQIEAELARPGLLPSDRVMLQAARQVHQRWLATWSAPTTTIPRRSKDIRRELEELIEKMEQPH